MDILCMGELLIDFVALESGVTVGDASGFVKAPGGAPANVAVAAARLGLQAGFIGQVGDDPFGRYLAGVLEADGVDVRGLRFSPDARTALAFVSLGPGGERSFVFYRNPSADMLMRPEDVDLSLVDSCRIFHYGSITLIGEPVRSATLATVRRAKAGGKLISYDPNLRMSLWPTAEAAKTGMLLGMQDADVVKVSQEELEFLTEQSHAGALWRDGMKLIIVTHGADGATLYTPRERFTSPGFAVESVDTTGAGDSFVAALLSGMLMYGDEFDRHLPEIARFANAVGAITTTKKGAIPALPTRQQAEAFLASQS
ncbi:MAG: PfkB family carbohydrate kinase [Anaerolineae bacterium]